MGKPRAALILLAAAAAIGAVFGAALTQLSYSVGISLFLDVLFPRHGLSDDLNSRLGAALVGLQAGVWLAPALMLPPLALGWAVLRHGRALLTAGAAALAVLVMATLAGAMLGLALGLIAPGYADALPLPQGLVDRDSYLRAALMHEGAFWGAGFGLLSGLVVVWRSRKAERD